MIDIARHIEYLLLNHECVVVPGLGSFIANDEPAHYDHIAHQFHAPSRQLGFTTQVSHNDPLLAASISRREQISIEAASHRIEAEVNTLKGQLQITGEVSLGRLGMLTKAADNDAPTFEPFDDSLPVRIYSALSTLNIRPQFTEETDTNIVPEESVRQRIIPTPLKIVASIIVLMVACGLLYSSRSLVDTSNTHFASLDTGLSSITGHEAAIEPQNMTDVFSREIILNIATPVENDNVANEAVSHANESSLAEESIPGKYLLVVGSFPSMTLAQKHIAYVGDSSLRIFNSEGKYRIYAASAASYDAAALLADHLRDKYPSVWVCRR